MTRIKLENIGDSRKTPIGDAEIMDLNFVQHRSGKYFTQYLYKDLTELLVKDMHRNVAKDYDNVILATGGEGSGKSGVIYDVLRKYKGESWSDESDIPAAYTYNMEFMRERMQDNDWGCGMFWMDETTQIASNRDWQSSDNKDFVSMLETFRSKKFLFAGCAPKLERVDVYLRDFRMRYHIHVAPMAFSSTGYKPRGIYELEKRNPQSGEMEHVGYGLYPDMPESAKLVYLPLKEKCQDDLRQRISTGGKGNKYKFMYETEKKRNNDIMLQLHDLKLVDDSQLMELFGYDNRGTFANALSTARQRKKGTI